MEMRDPMAMGVSDTRTHGDTVAVGTPQCGDGGHHGHGDEGHQDPWGHHGHGVTPDTGMRDTMVMGMRDTRTHGDTMAMGTPQIWR